MQDINKENIEKFENFMTLEPGYSIIPKDLLKWLIDKEFFIKPAAVKHHGAYSGGLFEHSFAMTKLLVDLTKNNFITWDNPRSPYIVGMLHDICKVEDYCRSIEENEKDPLGITWIYNKDKILTGHGDKSVMLLSQFINLTEEELMCIRFHMGAYETEAWDSYDKAIKKYASVLWTHTADMWASKVLNK